MSKGQRDEPRAEVSRLVECFDLNVAVLFIPFLTQHQGCGFSKSLRCSATPNFGLGMFMRVPDLRKHSVKKKNVKIT